MGDCFAIPLAPVVCVCVCVCVCREIKPVSEREKGFVRELARTRASERENWEGERKEKERDCVCCYRLLGRRALEVRRAWLFFRELSCAVHCELLPPVVSDINAHMNVFVQTWSLSRIHSHARYVYVRVRVHVNSHCQTKTKTKTKTLSLTHT
jgi:hypothetical protein